MGPILMKGYERPLTFLKYNSPTDLHFSSSGVVWSCHIYIDMFCSFFSIIGDPSKGYFCYAQGYTTHFFCVASFLWTTTIAFTLHRTVVRHKADVEDLEPMFHLYVWGTSGVMTVLCSIGNDHGHISRLGAWCWAQTGRTGKSGSFYNILRTSTASPICK
ncbi:glycolytic proteins transcriptional activator gcr1 [Castilleja foliolosa]|uniref:Glycolytic proteins transcriptional activator gcr1 n=1 Tax=Castilleja foliolosa TaxID=1961234 RepID=A0ABD3DWS9_9LAMI